MGGRIQSLCHQVLKNNKVKHALNYYLMDRRYLAG